LVKNLPDSPWRADARFAEGDALTELNKFEDALVVFDNVLRQFPEHPLAVEAAGRKGDCQFTLGRGDDARASFQKALDGARDTATRNQAWFKIGQCHEKAGKLDEAVLAYSKTLFEAPLAANEPPERFWAGKAARAAAGVKEQQQQWREAIVFYQKLGEITPDLRTLADDRIRKIRVERVILY
jgi:tetratricopeptide (TPR) repeat protein